MKRIDDRVLGEERAHTRARFDRAAARWWVYGFIAAVLAEASFVAALLWENVMLGAGPIALALWFAFVAGYFYNERVRATGRAPRLLPVRPPEAAE